MIKIIEDSEVEDMILKDNYILILCKKISSEIIKKIARKENKVGIYYRNEFILDTVNGVISKVKDKKKTKNLSYQLGLYPLQEDALKGLDNYEMFYDFIVMKNYFIKYYKIHLFWDERKSKCIYEKTTPLDRFGGSPLDNAFKSMRYINVNSKIFPKIKLYPDLQETLDSFVDETNISENYTD